MTHVSSDIVEAGRKVGEELARLTDGKGKVMYIDHAPGVGFARQLRSGFEEVIERRARHATCCRSSTSTSSRRRRTRSRARRITRNPDLAGAFVGVGFGSQGALPALEAAGKLDQVKTVGVRRLHRRTSRRCEAGQLDAVVSVAAREYGVDTVQAAVDALDGKDVPTRSSPRSAC